MSPDPDEPVQFLAVDERSAVWVIITLTADTKRHYCTFMPRPDTPSENVFKALKDAASMLEKYLSEKK